MLKSGKRKWSAKQGKLVKPADKLQVNKSYKKVVMKRALSLASEVPMYLKKFLARFVGLTVANVVSAAKIRFAQGWVNRSQNPQFREVPMFSIMKKLFVSIARLNPAGSLSAAKMQPLLLTFTLMVAALWVSPAAVAAEKETVFDPATGKTWTAPEYGGTLTWATKAYPKSVDVREVGGWAPHLISGVNEKLSFADWGLSREIHFDLYMVQTPEMTRGALAESWSMPDDTTFIWNIRKGVYWDDKAPVNGRALTADDIVFNWHRYLGLGDFSEDGPSAHVYVTQGLEIESVTATDKWTVEIKLTKPQFDVLGRMLHNMVFIYAPEIFEKYGDYKDWRNVVGTGPYRLTEYVDGSSATWEKKPNYWGYDEKFPQNRLPYIDELRSLLIPDVSARLAAIRTGKIDMLTNTGDAYIQNVDYIETLQRTNPEIEVWPLYTFIYPLLFNQSLPLMQDVNVRKALQMAVDRETISATFFKGWGKPAPYGFVNQDSKGLAWPYEEWPDEVKHEYEYHPEEAEALLDAAGYPRGADGYRFKVKFGHSTRLDPTYPELIMGSFEAIGVESELVMLTEAEVGVAFRAETMEWELMSFPYGHLTPQPHYIGFYLQNIEGQNLESTNFNKAKHPRMEALYYAAKETIDIEELKSIFRQVDEIMVKEHWGLVKSNSPKFHLNQPWVEGYFGEAGMGRGERNAFFARLWIDSELKKAMMGN